MCFPVRPRSAYNPHSAVGQTQLVPNDFLSVLTYSPAIGYAMRPERLESIVDSLSRVPLSHQHCSAAIERTLWVTSPQWGDVLHLYLMRVSQFEDSDAGGNDTTHYPLT